MLVYKDFNVINHHQWENLFTLYINSKSQTHICDNSSSNNYDYNNEEKHCAPMDSMIHFFHMF
jgi:hypothetical protein